MNRITDKPSILKTGAFAVATGLANPGSSFARKARTGLSEEFFKWSAASKTPREKLKNAVKASGQLLAAASEKHMEARKNLRVWHLEGSMENASRAIMLIERMRRKLGALADESPKLNEIMKRGYLVGASAYEVVSKTHAQRVLNEQTAFIGEKTKDPKHALSVNERAYLLRKRQVNDLLKAIDALGKRAGMLDEAGAEPLDMNIGRAELKEWKGLIETISKDRARMRDFKDDTLYRIAEEIAERKFSV